jgi:hypothetical protein
MQWPAAANQPAGMSGRGRGRPKVTDQNQHRCNRLLAALRPRDFALLEPHLQIVPIARGEFLHLEKLTDLVLRLTAPVSQPAVSHEAAWT